MFIRIRNDNGFEMCPTCANIESSDCELCSEGELYEEDEFATDNLELLVA